MKRPPSTHLPLEASHDNVMHARGRIVDVRVLSAANATAELNGMGTTLVGAIVNGQLVPITQIPTSSPRTLRPPVPLRELRIMTLEKPNSRVNPGWDLGQAGIFSAEHP